MANRDMPCGAKPKGPVLRANTYQAGGTIYPGDFVKSDANGQVVVAAASNALLGVALSYATSGVNVLVADDPNQRFIAQADDATINAQTDINLNYNITATSGSTAYKISRHEIDASTQATDSTLPLKVLRVFPEVNNALGDAVQCEFVINNHQLKGGTGTEGV
jgi:hypothetical protein